MGLIIVGLSVFAVLAVALMVRERRQADLPAAIVASAMWLLGDDRAEWGQAMTGELEQHRGPARWRFALGCCAAAIALPRPSGRGRWVVLCVMAAAAAAALLVAYGFVRYPGMIIGAGTWLALATLALTLIGFVLVTSLVTRQSSAGATGLICGCVVAMVWIAVGAVIMTGQGKASVFLLLLLPPLSVAVGMVGTRREGSRRAGRRVAVVSAVVAALAVFLVLAGDIMVTGGRPYDAGQLQDFAASGYRDIATYAVSDDLGTAMVLLLLMAGMTAGLGAIGATLAARRDR